MSKRIDVAAGERAPYPVNQATQVALTALEGDSMGRVVIRLDDPLVTQLDEWSEATDLLTGHTVAVRRADCGLGCKCAAEIKLVRYAQLDAEQEDGGEGVNEPISWAPKGKAPAKLVAGVNWWLKSDRDHSEDVVALTNDHQDALILSGFNDVMCVVWVDPEGLVRTLKGQWDTVHEEKEEAAATPH